MDIRPEITISSLDASRLDDLIGRLPNKNFAGKIDLEEELARANIIEPQLMPANIVTMNSTVRFVIAPTKDEFELTLVYPKDMDSSGTKISILAPVGSALLGLTQGDKIEWPKPGGGTLKVEISEITYQPERAGDLHR
tara:strand:+ start:1459 stop:1872 length:414 start_codon:yes stop_codon:yes gene_type:complete